MHKLVILPVCMKGFTRMVNDKGNLVIYISFVVQTYLPNLPKFIFVNIDEENDYSIHTTMDTYPAVTHF